MLLPRGYSKYRTTTAGYSRVYRSSGEEKDGSWPDGRYGWRKIRGPFRVSASPNTNGVPVCSCSAVPIPPNCHGASALQSRLASHHMLHPRMLLPSIHNKCASHAVALVRKCLNRGKEKDDSGHCGHGDMEVGSAA
jgi:hypothetical protein